MTNTPIPLPDIHSKFIRELAEMIDEAVNDDISNAVDELITKHRPDLTPNENEEGPYEELSLELYDAIFDRLLDHFRTP